MSIQHPHALVIGWPVDHSLSPTIHGYWLKNYSLIGSYTKEAVRPEALEQFISELFDRGFCGTNVTLPHKEQTYKIIEQLGGQLSPTAQAIGAVNTVWYDVDGKICGDNTDIYGFLANLDHQASGWEGERSCAFVLGAGGSARAIVYSLLSRGFKKVVVINRTVERAHQLAAQFGSSVIAGGWEEPLVHLRPQVSLVVNTTSLGMKGQPYRPYSLEGFSGEAVVTDIVYTPLITPFLTQARSEGFRIVDGLGMLLHQAVPGFEHWFGIKPEVTDELRKQVLVHMTA